MSAAHVLLAESAGYALWADGYTLELCRSDGSCWPLGEMYGSPVAALITRTGRYAVIIGCGVMVCDLHRFGQPFVVGLDWTESPVVYLKFDADDVWWFTDVYQDEASGEIRLVTSLMGQPVGLYALNTGTLEFRALFLELARTP